MSPKVLVERGLSTLTSLGPAALGGILLVLCALSALLAANSPWAADYLALFQLELRLGVGSLTLEKPLTLWINDGLMAVFFLLVGLEIKRELVEGTLSSFRKAGLPVFAAIGGMATPALIYALINANSDGGDMRGWAIPSATDIAFALGILALLGSRIPVAIKVFLTAVAVVDDLGAILIIAVFFTDAISLQALGVAALSLLGLSLLNRGGVTRTPAYLALGAVLWLAVLKSGVHATVAGVLLALFIPTRGPAGSTQTAPLHRWEHALQPWVLFAIMPVFALANAGVVISDDAATVLKGPVSLGVALGLLLGNPIGITFFSWLAVRSGLSELPRGVTWARLHAVSWLAGIGFTMSLFIAGLAVDGAALAAAKVSLLVASACAGLIGTALLLITCREPSAREAPRAATGKAAKRRPSAASLPRAPATG